MTPGRDWRADYAGRPVARGKLEYCDRVVREVAGTPPVLAAEAAAEDEEEDFFAATLADIYPDAGAGAEELPGLDGALRAALEAVADGGDGGGRVPGGALVR